MIPPSAALETEVLRRLASLRDRLGPELGAAFGELASRLRLFEGVEGKGYFSHPMAMPALELPRWVAAHLERRGAVTPPERLAAFVEAAAAGYLRVRVEDDWFDEGIGEPGAAMMLGQAFIARHQALLARELPQGSPFWSLYEEVWNAYGEAMLFERRVHGGEVPHDAEAFQRVLVRSHPLILPPAAALFAADRAGDLGALWRFVRELVAGHQLFSDLLHLRKDEALGNLTHVRWRLGAGRAGATAATVQAELVRGGFDAIVADARGHLERAAAAAAELEMPEAARFVADRAALMGEVQTRFFEALFLGLHPTDTGTEVPAQRATS